MLVFREGVQEEENAKVHTRYWDTKTDFESICRILSKNCSHRSFGAIRSSSRAAFKLGSSRVELVHEENRVALSSTDFALIFDVIAHLQVKD